jgi:hypothetical protein
MSQDPTLPPLHCGFDALSAEQAECLRQWATSAVLADRSERAGLIEQQAAQIERLRDFVGLVAAPLMIDGPNHSAVVYQARAALAEQKEGKT